MEPAQVLQGGNVEANAESPPKNSRQGILLLVCYPASSTCLSQGFQKERDSQPVDPPLKSLRGVPPCGFTERPFCQRAGLGRTTGSPFLKKHQGGTPTGAVHTNSNHSCTRTGTSRSPSQKVFSAREEAGPLEMHVRLPGLKLLK